jgi:hypothetical protein
MATNTWDETAPLGSSQASSGDDAIRQFKLDVRERIDQEHIYRTGNEAAANDTGTADIFSSNTIGIASRTYTTNQWRRGVVRITGGTGAGQVREVSSNTINTLTVNRSWTTIPDGTSVFRVDSYVVGVHRYGTGHILYGVDADKPTTGYILGRLYYSTDTEQLFYDIGTAWVNTNFPGKGVANTFSTIQTYVQRLRHSTFTPITVANGTNNDLAIGTTAGVIKLEGNTAVATITGLVAGSQGDIIILYNSTAFNIFLSMADSGSTAANRIIRNLPGTSIVIPQNGMISLIYNDGSRWSLLDDYVNPQADVLLYAVASGTDTYTAALTPTLKALVTGMLFHVLFTNANTITTPTLELESLGALTIVDVEGNALVVGAIVANHKALIWYDGTNAVLLNPVNPIDELSKADVETGSFTTASISNSGGVVGNTIAHSLGTEDLIVDLSLKGSGPFKEVSVVAILDDGASGRLAAHLVGEGGPLSNWTQATPPAAGNIRFSAQNHDSGNQTVTIYYRLTKRIPS